MSTGEFTIEPEGPFSLAAAAAFGFGPRLAKPGPYDGTMRLAFALDGFEDHAGVVVHEEDGGALRCVVTAGRDLAAIERQLRRILSLDPAGRVWAKVGERDPVIGRLQPASDWLRPVQFHSPYEAAAWAVISHRKHRTAALALRDRLSEELGAVIELEGETLPAFPLPQRLLELESFTGYDERRLERLRGVAQAALEGRLDADRLRLLDPTEAAAEVQRLPGIGPFYAQLVVVRSTGATDVLASEEPHLLGHVAHFYDLPAPPGRDELLALAEPWRPFRTWAMVLIRWSGDRAGRGV